MVDEVECAHGWKFGIEAMNVKRSSSTLETFSAAWKIIGNSVYKVRVSLLSAISEKFRNVSDGIDWIQAI